MLTEISTVTGANNLIVLGLGMQASINVAQHSRTHIKTKKEKTE
jgi:hypothetical protein